MENEKINNANHEADEHRRRQHQIKPKQDCRQIPDRKHDIFMRVRVMPLVGAVPQQPVEQPAVRDVFGKGEENDASEHEHEPSGRPRLMIEERNQDRRHREGDEVGVVAKGDADVLE